MGCTVNDKGYSICNYFRWSCRSVIQGNRLVMQVYIFTESSPFFISTTNVETSEYVKMILSFLNKEEDLKDFDISPFVCLELLKEVNQLIEKLLPKLEPLPKNIGRKVKLILFGQEYIFKPTTSVGSKLMNYHSLRNLLLDASDNNNNLKVRFIEDESLLPDSIRNKISNISNDLNSSQLL